MKSKRSITINNNLVQGICNCSCITCNINKPSYTGPKANQSEKVVEKIVERVQEACLEGLYIRAIGNSGDGEPTLHPEFSQRMAIFGELKRKWNFSGYPSPDICIVTNGLRLYKPDIVEALEKNNISVKISFPTADPIHYTEIMQPLCGEKGENIFKELIPAIGHIMSLRAQNKIPGLEFHISPPFLDYVRPDFPQTINVLSTLANKNGLRVLNLKIFPVLSNRTGLVKRFLNNFDMYKDYFKRYNGKIINGVVINMFYSYDFFYPNFRDFVDLLRAFNFPCLWYGNIYLSSFGDSDCPNDQNIQEPLGNLFTHSLREIMEIKEERLPGAICKSCNQTPAKLFGLGLLKTFHLTADLKLRWKLLRAKEKVK